MIDSEKIEGNVFVEKSMYSEPPHLDGTATEEEIREAWANWIKSEVRLRAAHKAVYTKSQKPGQLPNFDTSGLMMKTGGVWRQNNSMTGLVGSSDAGSLETVLIQGATQDKSISFRGKRAGRKSRKRSGANKKEAKRQSILRGKR